MKRLIEKTVFSELVIAWRLATSPTSRSPLLVKATMEGVVRLPSALGMTTGSPPSMTATQLFVVPRSMPITFATVQASLNACTCLSHYNTRHVFSVSSLLCTATGQDRLQSHLPSSRACQLPR